MRCFLAFILAGLGVFSVNCFYLSPSGAEGARRSWAFTVDRIVHIGWPSSRLGPRLGWATGWLVVSRQPALGLLAALAIALIGGTAAGQDAAYRFPGPFLFGSDARSVTPELLATSEWFSARFGTANNIITDRYTGLVFGSFGLQDPAAPSAAFPSTTSIWRNRALQSSRPFCSLELNSLEIHIPDR